MEWKHKVMSLAENNMNANLNSIELLEPLSREKHTFYAQVADN